MKWIVDAQLPFGLVIQLRNKGWDVLHTNNLPDSDRTTDSDLRQLCERENRVLITKDTDFLHSYYINRSPGKLLLVTTGNMKNTAFFELFERYVIDIERSFQDASLIELSNTALIVHE